MQYLLWFASLHQTDGLHWLTYIINKVEDICSKMYSIKCLSYTVTIINTRFVSSIVITFDVLKCSYLKIECWAQLLFWPQPAALPGSGAGHDEHLSVSEGHPGALASASWSFWYVHWWTASQTSVLKNGKGMQQKKNLKWRILFKNWLYVKCAKQFLTISVFV